MSRSWRRKREDLLQELRENRVQALKPHLGTDPRVLYAGIDKEVR